MSLALIVTGLLASLALFLCLVRKWQVDELEDLVSRVKQQRSASNNEADENPEDSEGLHLSHGEPLSDDQILALSLNVERLFELKEQDLDTLINYVGHRLDELGSGDVDNLDDAPSDNHESDEYQKWEDAFETFSAVRYGYF
jgi:hypothetical protein